MKSKVCVTPSNKLFQIFQYMKRKRSKSSLLVLFFKRLNILGLCLDICNTQRLTCASLRATLFMRKHCWKNIYISLAYVESLNRYPFATLQETEGVRRRHCSSSLYLRLSQFKKKMFREARGLSVCPSKTKG